MCHTSEADVNAAFSESTITSIGWFKKLNREDLRSYSNNSSSSPKAWWNRRRSAQPHRRRPLPCTARPVRVPSTKTWTTNTRWRPPTSTITKGRTRPFLPLIQTRVGSLSRREAATPTLRRIFTLIWAAFRLRSHLSRLHLCISRGKKIHPMLK